MTDTNPTPVTDLIDRNALDPDGDKIGSVFDVYLDNASGQPEWLAVNTGLFGTKVSFVPIAGATLAGDDVVVAYPKSLVKDAPNIDPDGQLTPDEEGSLYSHYSIEPSASDVGTTDRADVAGTTGRTETDDAMTRSEEELDVSTRQQQTGKARLRKWVETEDVQITVPIRRERARLVTEPITDANRDDAMSGDDLADDEHEVTLSEEVVDVHKKVVPKERVRLEKDVETEDVDVDEQVRKERVEMDTDNDGGRSNR